MPNKHSQREENTSRRDDNAADPPAYVIDSVAAPIPATDPAVAPSTVTDKKKKNQKHGDIMPR